MAKTIVLLSNLRIHSAEFFGGNYHIKCRAKQKAAGAAGAVGAVHGQKGAAHGGKGGRGNKRDKNHVDKKTPLGPILAQGGFPTTNHPPRKKSENH